MEETERIKKATELFDEIKKLFPNKVELSIHGLERLQFLDPNKWTLRGFGSFGVRQ